MDKKTTTIVLCLFLGGIGAHKFYQNKVGTGIMYALFCWTFIPAFLSVIDLIVLLSKLNKD